MDRPSTWLVWLKWGCAPGAGESQRQWVSFSVHLFKDVMVLMCLMTIEVGLDHVGWCPWDFPTVKLLSFPL